jgi:DNA ligase (NAD+)
MSKTTTGKSKKQKVLNYDLLIQELINDPTMFILNNDANTILNIIKYTSDKYYNDQPVISDEIFDFLIDTIKEIDPENAILKKIGSKVISKNKVKLPYNMGSMDKLKQTDEKQLLKWITKYKKPYIYSDKLDGVSALLLYQDNDFKLYTRGDGEEGSDISYLIKYIPTFKNINKKKLVDGLAVRGELIMSINNFTKYQNKMANARNMVSGLVNSKTIDKEIIKDVEFIAYELINPWITNNEEQFKKLSKIGLKVVNYHILDDDLNVNLLSDILSQRKNSSEYEIDGIIISVNHLSDRVSSGNPEYAFAYKDSSLLSSAHVEVLNVQWNISKDGYIKPILNLVPTKLSGVTISNVTALHAKYVLENKLGPGAIIELIRSGDVIPKIQKVIKQADEAQMPPYNYVWTDTNVDIMTVDETTDQKIKELTFFFKKLDIANINESTVKKMIDIGLDNIPAIINITKSDLEQIQGFKEKMVDKIYQNITERLSTLTLLDIMIASNTFGHGIGERKLKKITEVYPNIIKLYTDNNTEDIINMIKEIEGFDTITAEHFVTGLDRFIDLYNELNSNMRKQLMKSIKIKKVIGNKFADKSILFSGFRNKEWEKIITDNGGKISSAISSKTSLLVTTKEDLIENKNSKIIKANQLNILIITKEQFENEYIN